jgi:hypothetical protein
MGSPKRPPVGNSLDLEALEEIPKRMNEHIGQDKGERRWNWNDHVALGVEHYALDVKDGNYDEVNSK